jgi:hypothetical protein
MRKNAASLMSKEVMYIYIRKAILYRPVKALRVPGG